MKLLVPILAAFVSFSGIAENWPQCRGPYQNGFTKEKYLTVWAEAGLKVVWRVAATDEFSFFAVAGDSSDYTETARFKVVSGKCWSTPVVANGHIYIRSTKEEACVQARP
tara:strand:- start:380 stop:709 length:330 start_codon:yes stop_codon:yes gene_type:complete